MDKVRLAPREDVRDVAPLVNDMKRKAVNRSVKLQVYSRLVHEWRLPQIIEQAKQGEFCLMPARRRRKKRKSYKGPWRVYTGPFETPGDMRFIEVLTHRIGHKPATTGAFLGGE